MLPRFIWSQITERGRKPSPGSPTTCFICAHFFPFISMTGKGSAPSGALESAIGIRTKDSFREAR
jgi:hypothetical protein